MKFDFGIDYASAEDGAWITINDPIDDQPLVIKGSDEPVRMKVIGKDTTAS